MLRRSRSVRPLLLGAGLVVRLLIATAAMADTSDSPQVVASWAAGPMETRVAFDRPVPQEWEKALVGRLLQFDLTHRVVDGRWRRGAAALTPPLGTLKVAAARLDPERRTLTLTTDPHPREAVYLLDQRPSPGAAERLPFRVTYDLTGVAVTWTAPGTEAEPSWLGWWPEFDSQKSQQQTKASVDHERGFGFLAREGQATFESLVLLPKGRVLLQVASSAPLEATLNGENPTTAAKTSAEFAVESTGDPSDLYLTVQTKRSSAPFFLRVTYRLEGEPEPRVLPRERSVLPWAPPTPPSAGSPPPPPPFRLTGGDRARGEAAFFGERAKCSNCHRVQGKGGTVGPDLSAAGSRGIEALFHDIAEPSATIHPDFNGYSVALKDGRILVGVVRAEGADRIQVTDTDAKITEVPRAEVEELRPSGTSIMPVGLVGALGEEESRDILAYLLSVSSASSKSIRP